MRRTAVFSDNGDDEDSTAYDTTDVSRASARRTTDTSLSPAASFGSDKENRPANVPRGKRRAMGPPDTPTTERGVSRTSLGKRKLGERDTPLTSTQALHRKKLEEVSEKELYDPEQSMAQRRALRKDYRDLSKELTDSRSEYLASGSDGLIQTLERSNQLYTSVKQTSDATLDSRLLVSTADLSMKRTTQLNLGDNTTGIDVDDLVSKCITFMRRGPSEGDAITQTQTQRRRRLGDDSDEEGNAGYDEGDAFNWEYLGRHACCPYNVRPPVPGFLLGPLSVRKRVRKVTEKRARQERKDPNEAIRPQQLEAKDMEQSENSNLTVICKKVRAQLNKQCQEAPERVQEEIDEDMTDEEIKAIMAQHGIADDGGVPLFQFAVNPKSFGQTVENLFYISFLIRDGAVGLSTDSDGLPTLSVTEAQGAAEQQRLGTQKHQAIFHLDFETWEDIIENFAIQESIIPHRQPDPAVPDTATSWYA